MVTSLSWSVAGLIAGLMLAAAGGTAQASPLAGWQEKGKAAFEIYEDSAKEHRWRLKDGDGKILATSGEGYKEKGDCKKAVEKIKSDVKGDNATFEVYEDNAKEHRWRLKAKNGQIVASAPSGYKTKADAEAAVTSLKKAIPDAEVKEAK